MQYLNQLLYRHIPYRTHAADETMSEADKQRDIARSGCGLCCTCMMIDQLTDKSLSLEECVKISEGCGANYTRGTSMRVLAPVIAEKFGLDYKPTNDPDEVVRHLQLGGHAIALVEINPETKLGLFTNGAHYISLISTDGKDFCILDPSYKQEKFEREDRVGKVDTSHAPYLYCNIQTVHGETVAKEGKIKYFLFARKR